MIPGLRAPDAGRFPGDGPMGSADVVFGKVVGIHIADDVITPEGLVDILNGSPYKSLADMVAAHKGKPKALNFATFGAVTPGHFAAVEFAEQASVKVEPIHHRSTGDAVTAIVSGSVSGAWVSVAVASGQVKGGKMRGLAIARQYAPMSSRLPMAIPLWRRMAYAVVT